MLESQIYEKAQNAVRMPIIAQMKKIEQVKKLIMYSKTTKNYATRQ